MTPCIFLFASLKGILHPKMKILSSTHPEVVANLYEFLYSAEHKGRYVEGTIGTKQNTMEVNGEYYNKKILWKSMVPIILQHIFLCEDDNNNNNNKITTT